MTLHEQARMVHTDIKPENIGVRGYRDDGTVADVVLLDLGSAVVEGGHRPVLVGTLPYRAPEVFAGAVTGDVTWAHGVDVWAVGCVMAELFLGHMLFPVLDSVGFQYALERLTGVSVTWIDGCVDAHTVKRCHAVGLLTPGMWGSNAVDGRWGDLLLRMLQVNPQNRCSAREALQHPFFVDTCE